MKIGFIGIGVMGSSMARHLMEADHEVAVYTRTRSKAQPLLDAGADWAENPAALASGKEAIITIVGYPEDVESVYLGAEGLLANADPGTLLIDMTTSRPDLAQTLGQKGRQHGLGVLDAPVSGGDVGARKARLSIMVGGPREDFDRALPLFQVMGQNIVYQGEAGAGQHTKMSNQIAIAAGMVAVCESMAYAEKAGLDPKTVLESIGKGAAGSWSLNNLAPRMIEGDEKPGFYVKHFIKDMRIAKESAKKLGLETPGLDLALQLYEELSSQGGDECGTQALYRLFRS